MSLRLNIQYSLDKFFCFKSTMPSLINTTNFPCTAYDLTCCYPDTMLCEKPMCLDSYSNQNTNFSPVPFFLSPAFTPSNLSKFFSKSSSNSSLVIIGRDDGSWRSFGTSGLWYIMFSFGWANNTKSTMFCSIFYSYYASIANGQSLMGFYTWTCYFWFCLAGIKLNRKLNGFGLSSTVVSFSGFSMLHFQFIRAVSSLSC